MSTLIENVAKVEAANTAIGNAISSFGVTVPEGSKLSDKPALIGKIPHTGPAGWGRPANWPRIDLIEIGKTDPDVCYFIVQKPYDTVNHGFCLLSKTSDGKPWRMDRVSVTADGSSVEAIADTEQTANSGEYINFQFPDSDQAGSVYAVRISSPTGAYLFNLIVYRPPDTPVADSYHFISGVVLEAVVHQPSAKYLTLGSNGWEYSGPRHIVYTGCPKGQYSYFVRGLNTNLKLVELRKGSLMEVINYDNPGFACNETVLEMDDDAQVLMNTENTYSRPYVKPDSSGKIDTLGRFVDKATGLPVDWSTVDVQHCFVSCNPLTSVSLPAGFGSSAAPMNSCFENCFSLASISFQPGFGQNSTNISRCFRFCTTLTSLSFPAGFGSAATNISSCFYVCLSLVSVVLPAGFGQNVTNTDDCFYGCSSLTNITGDPNFKASLNLSSCSKLTHDSLMVVINGLQTVTATKTLTLGATNLAKLTDDDKKIATDKGWTLA